MDALGEVWCEHLQTETFQHTKTDYSDIFSSLDIVFDIWSERGGQPSRQGVWLQSLDFDFFSFSPLLLTYFLLFHLPFIRGFCLLHLKLLLMEIDWGTLVNFTSPFFTYCFHPFLLRNTLLSQHMAAKGGT